MTSTVGLRPPGSGATISGTQEVGWLAQLCAQQNRGFACFICGETEQVEMHHVRRIRKMRERKPTGFHAVMGALNRNQIPVCKECHETIHRGEYDGIRLLNLAYDFAARPTEPGTGEPDAIKVASRVREGAVGVPHQRAWPPTSLT